MASVKKFVSKTEQDRAIENCIQNLSDESDSNYDLSSSDSDDGVYSLLIMSFLQFYKCFSLAS